MKKMEINEEWVRANLWALCYAWERGAGNILSTATDASNELVRLICAELREAGSDPREGEWETHIAQIVERQDAGALLDLTRWIASDEDVRRSIIAEAARHAARVKSPARAEAARINGAKGGRPKKSPD